MKRLKAQLELWMLTKMAMLFFIVALSLIILNISNIEKAGLCKEQAMATSRLISSSINQVTTGSSEDEILTFKFQPTLAAGGEKTDRYVVNLSVKELQSNKMQLSIKVAALNDKTCEASSTVFLDQRKTSRNIKLQATPYQPRTENSEEGRVLTLMPSNSKIEQRTRFLVIAKCSEKVFGGTQHLRFIDCGEIDPERCVSRADVFTC